MKYQFTLVALILVNLCAIALGDAPMPRAQRPFADATQIIAAEAQTTQDTIAHMLRQMAEHSEHVEFNAADYRAKTVIFRRRVSAVLQTYEAQLRNSILPRFYELANRYNSIYNSESISAVQKTQLLAQQLPLIQREVWLLVDEYHQAIRVVYEAVGDMPFEKQSRHVFDPRMIDRRRHGCPRRTDYYVEHFYATPQSGHRLSAIECVREIPNRQVLEILVPAREISHNRIFHELIFPELMNGCRSQICLALSASDAAHYLELISTTINREISVLLDNQTTRLTLIRADVGTREIQDLLSRSDYPTEAHSLPFDTQTE